VQMLGQIKDHYRNPLLSADAAVSLEEATSFFGMASGLISMMAEQLLAQQHNEGRGGKKSSGGGSGEDDSDIYDFRMGMAG